MLVALDHAASTQRAPDVLSFIDAELARLRPALARRSASDGEEDVAAVETRRDPTEQATNATFYFARGIHPANIVVHRCPPVLARCSLLLNNFVREQSLASRKKQKDIDDRKGSLGFEEKLWAAADLLRNNVDPAEYKHVVLGLLFLKYISDAFSARQGELATLVVTPGSDYFVVGKNKQDAELAGLLEDPDEYTAANVFWVPHDARWEHIQGKRGKTGAHENVAGFAMSAQLAEIQKHGYVLTPGRYVGAEDVEDDGDGFEVKRKQLAGTLRQQQAEAVKLDAAIAANLTELGYGK